MKSPDIGEHTRGAIIKMALDVEMEQKVNLHFFYVIHWFAFIFSLKYNIYVYKCPVDI